MCSGAVCRTWLEGWNNRASGHPGCSDPWWDRVEQVLDAEPSYARCVSSLRSRPFVWSGAIRASRMVSGSPDGRGFQVFSSVARDSGRLRTVQECKDAAPSISRQAPRIQCKTRGGIISVKRCQGGSLERRQGERARTATTAHPLETDVRAWARAWSGLGR